MFEGETILPIAELFGGCSTLRAISGGHTGPQCDAPRDGNLPGGLELIPVNL